MSPHGDSGRHGSALWHLKKLAPLQSPSPPSWTADHYVFDPEDPKDHGIEAARGCGPPPDHSRTLEYIRQELGSSLLAALPRLDQVNFEWNRSHHSFRVFDIRLQVGTWISLDHQCNGRPVWANLRYRHDAWRAPSMYIDVELPGEPVSLCITLSKELENNCRVRFEPVFFEMTSPNAQKVYALVKYYYLLAAEANLYGFKEHRIPYNQTFATHLKIACRKFGGSNSGYDTRMDGRKGPAYRPCSKKPLRRRNKCNSRRTNGLPCSPGARYMVDPKPSMEDAGRNCFAGLPQLYQQNIPGFQPTEQEVDTASTTDTT